MMSFHVRVIICIGLCVEVSSAIRYTVYSVDDCSQWHNKTCPCTDISYYTLAENLTFDNVELMFSLGHHELSEAFQVNNVENFSMYGSHTSGLINTPIIRCVNGAGFSFFGIMNFRIIGLNFSNCSKNVSDTNGIISNLSATRIGLYFHNITNLTLKFININGTEGYGAFLSNIYGHILIEHSYFQYSHDSEDFQGGNMLISYEQCSTDFKSNISAKFIIQNSTFTHGQSMFHNVSSGIVVIFNCSEISWTLVVNNTLLMNNYGCNCFDNSPLYSPDPAIRPFGGNMAIMFKPSEICGEPKKKKVQIENSKFSGGRALRGGGLFIQFSKNTTTFTEGITIKNCLFQNNTALVDGGGVYFQQEESVSSKEWSLKIEDSIFHRNFVQTEYDAGIGLSVTYYSDLMAGKSSAKYKATIQNCTFSYNKNLPVFYQAENNNEKTKVRVTSSGSAALYISQQPQELLIKSCSFQDNEVTAVAIFRSVITIEGYVNIYNNSGYEGGGIVLCEASYILMKDAAVLNISRNNADLSGGGIFAESQCVQKRPLCFYQIRPNFDNSTKIILEYNTAKFAGSQLYGGTVEDCHIPGVDRDIFFELFDFQHSQNDSSYIASDPLEICFCDSSHKPNCSITTKHLEGIYSGESPNVSLVAVGQYNGTVPGVVEFGIFENGTLSDKIKKTTVRDVDTKCSTYDFTLLSENKEETVIIRIKNAHANYRLNLQKKLIVVPIKDIPLGFHRNSEDRYDCIAKPNISKFGFRCIVDSSSQAVIEKNSGAWLGSSIINGKKEFVVYPVCPGEYCKTNWPVPMRLKTNNITFDSDQQCQAGRVGTLCGKCKLNMSLSLGTHHCLQCSHFSFIKTLGISVGFAVVGLVLVTFLLVFNITMTQGTFSGFLFYANVFYAFRSALLGYTGQAMSVANKISRNLYYFIIAPSNLVVHVNGCFYNGLDMTGHIWLNFLEALYLHIIIGTVIVISKYSTRVSRRLASNTVPVLATIFILSNTVINISVIYALTPANLNYEGALIHEHVMLYDGTVGYWSNKHIPLFIAGCMFGIFSAIFTLLLLFIQPLQRYSHWRALRWVNKIKPLLDSYSCPHIIKPYCRFWNGFLLLMRNILYCIFMFVGSSYSKDDILNAITAACLAILFLSWVLGGVYTKKSLNLLSASYIFNLGILSIVLKSETSFRNKNIALVISLSVTSVTFLVTMLFHIYSTIRGNTICCRNSVVTMFPTIQREYRQLVGYPSNNEGEIRGLKATEKQNSQHYYCSEYREPLL